MSKEKLSVASESLDTISQDHFKNKMTQNLGSLEAKYKEMKETKDFCTVLCMQNYGVLVKSMIQFMPRLAMIWSVLSTLTDNIAFALISRKICQCIFKTGCNLVTVANIQQGCRICAVLYKKPFYLY